jgi:glutamate 5-kinase
VTGVKGGFAALEAVEIADPDGQVFAKGLCRLDAAGLREVAGLQTGELPDGLPHEVVHRDDLVVLP